MAMQHTLEVIIQLSFTLSMDVRVDGQEHMHFLLKINCPPKVLKHLNRY